jgi:hypothetical protein
MQNVNLFEVRHVSASISRPPELVYEFAATPENLPRWATGLGKSFHRRSDGDWVADGGPLGSATVRFVERNRFGVIDHDVTLPTGETVHNPLRVLPNGTGSEVVFTVFRRWLVSYLGHDSKRHPRTVDRRRTATPLRSVHRERASRPRHSSRSVQCRDARENGVLPRQSPRSP